MGAKAIADFLQKLQVYKSLGDDKVTGGYGTGTESTSVSVSDLIRHF